MSRTTVRPRVLVAGAGLGGTATAIRLLHFARSPLEVVLLERRPDYRSAGVAYHRDGNPWEHVFNIQAGRMSLFREDVLDFVDWANEEADRREWPGPWAGARFTEQGPAPRRIFQDYLADRLAAAAREAAPGVSLVEADGEATDLEVSGETVQVAVRGLNWELAEARAGAEEGTVLLRADHVVLATGLELKDLPFASEVLDHPCFVRQPYSVEGVRKLRALPGDASVVIVGTVLSAYDSAGLLLRAGHTGPIRLVSRSGTLFRTYPGGHEHEVVRLPCPASLLEPYRGRREFVARFAAEWRAACAQVGTEHPGIHPAVVAERVSKAWEPYVPGVVERIPGSELREILDQFGTRMAALRVGAVQYTMGVVEESLRRGGPLELVGGRVASIAAAGSGRLAVTVAGADGDRVLEADLVVSNFGKEADYTRVCQPLWRNLLRKGMAVPHRRTGRGLEVDASGILLDRGGAVAGPVSAIGTLREGDEIVRNGRTGAFTFNLAVIKNHSVAVAAHIVEQLQFQQAGVPIGLPAALPTLPGSSPDPSPHGNPEEADHSVLNHAVALEVRRLAARERRTREELEARVEACLRELDGRRPSPDEVSPDALLLRTAVSREAVRRLTDVTVTPRKLRRQLGMERADDPEA
ncbi:MULTISPECIES: FAD/NAD(P)-binding protein [unclassified Streptomyces]|uniref:FAD/NAD(P)-binding protein n=1 Tax=unclassified Streptomyces TaxID=2593676 RepID=UPI000CD5105F|nr:MULTISPECIES: FAD/NAD(P)-binding protein [unclassified Streptomyces]